MAFTNKEYWARRSAMNKSITRDERALNKSLKKYYEAESKKLSNSIGSYYARYGENNVVQYRQMLERLDDADRNLLYRDWDSFAQKYPQYRDMLPVRDSIYKLNRMEGLQTSIEIQQLEIGAKEIEDLQAHFGKVARLGADSVSDLLGGNFNRIDVNIAEMAVGNPWYQDESFSDRIWDNKKSLSDALSDDVLHGLIRGDDYKTLARTIQSRFERVSRNNIERLIFTEDTYLSNEGAMLQYVNDPDFEEYEFMANTGCCEYCKALNEQRFKIDDRQAGTNFPPMHPWCRCTFVPIYKER